MQGDGKHIDMPKKFLIFSPSYNPDNGGIIALHKLCSVLNELGHEAYLTRLFTVYPISRKNIARPLSGVLRSIKRDLFYRYHLSPALRTKYLKSPPDVIGDEWIVIYPELVFGNPLSAKNVVRWFLHNPGFHGGDVFFGRDEFHVDYNDFTVGFSCPGAYKSAHSLFITHFPSEYYNFDGALPPEQRRGTAYCLRKGSGKPICHDLNDSVLIDGMSHEQIAAIFKRVKTFISYDIYTAYSIFAVMCGTNSVIVPDKDKSIEQWHEAEDQRHGIAYGFDDVERAKVTAPLLLESIKEREQMNLKSAARFVQEATDFFNERARAKHK